MAEIKSTLDLIMEKTKNMTLSDEEKKALHQKELQNKMKGWVQHYEDEQLGLGIIKEYIDEENEDDRPYILAGLKKEALQRIDPETDGKRMLQLLHDVLGEDLLPITRRIDAFRNDRQQQMMQQTKIRLQALADRGIQGSAVIPNLDQDQAWQDWLATAKASFTKSLL